MDKAAERRLSLVTGLNKFYRHVKSIRPQGYREYTFTHATGQFNFNNVEQIRELMKIIARTGLRRK